jgi:hypothetical protein
MNHGGAPGPIGDGGSPSRRARREGGISSQRTVLRRVALCLPALWLAVTGLSATARRPRTAPAPSALTVNGRTSPLDPLLLGVCAAPPLLAPQAAPSGCVVELLGGAP